jgi:hypothetical protein
MGFTLLRWTGVFHLFISLIWLFIYFIYLIWVLLFLYIWLWILFQVVIWYTCLSNTFLVRPHIADSLGSLLLDIVHLAHNSGNCNLWLFSFPRWLTCREQPIIHADTRSLRPLPPKWLDRPAFMKCGRMKCLTSISWWWILTMQGMTDMFCL